MTRGKPFEKGNKVAKGGKRAGAGRKPDAYKEKLRAQMAKLKTDPIAVIAKLMNAKTSSDEVKLKAAQDLANRMYGRSPTGLQAMLDGDVDNAGVTEIRVTYQKQIQDRDDAEDD